MKIKKGYLMVLISGILWGSIGLFTTQLSSYGLSSAQIACLRLVSGTLFLGVMLLIVKGWKVFRIDRKGILWCALLGVFAEALFNVSYTRAVSVAGMAVAAVLLYTAPIFVCIMSMLFFKEIITKKKLMALIVNIIGCELAVTGGGLSGLNIPVAGLVAGLAAGFFFASFTIISTAALKDYDPLIVLFYGMLIGAVILAVISNPWDNPKILINTKVLAVTAVYGLIPTCAAYSIYLIGLSDNLETSRVPVISSVEIIMAAVTGTVVLGQDLSVGKVVGILIIILSIAMMNLRLRTPLGIAVRNSAAINDQD